MVTAAEAERGAELRTEERGVEVVASTGAANWVVVVDRTVFGAAEERTPVVVAALGVPVEFVVRVPAG